MLRITVANGLVVSLLLSGCYSATEADFQKVSIPAHIEKSARDQVQYALKDPSSAQFRNIRGYSFSGPGGGYVVCGEVNGKNSFGGYTGFQPFRTNVGNAQSSSAVYINDLPARSMPCG